MATFVLIVELLGTVSFAASAALLAIRKKMDVFGVCMLALTTSVGGGITRDLLLGITPPSLFRNPVYAAIAIVVALIVFQRPVRYYLTGNHIVYQRAMLALDSLGLGIFVVSGVRVVYSMFPDASLFLCAFIGVITGVGGGVLRDMMSGDTPYIFVKDVYASAALCGALVCAMLWKPFGEVCAMLAGAAVIWVLRLLSATFKWNLPHAD